MTNQIINYKTLQSLQHQLNDSDVNMASRLGVEPRLYRQLKVGEKPLSESCAIVVSILLEQLETEAKSPSIRELFEQLGTTRHNFAAKLNLKPNRVRKSIESDNDELLRKVLALSLEHPELDLIDKLSKR